MVRIASPERPESRGKLNSVSLTFGAPQALWLLVGLPLIWLAHLVTRTNFNPRQRFTQAAARSLLLAALALGLARPVISSTSSHQSIVYAVDVSHSVASHAIEAAAAKIDELNTALQPSHTRIVTFGKRAATTASTATLRQLAKSRTDAPAADGPDGSASDLEAALYAARGELAPEHVPRIVLFSDGHPTAGDVGSGVTHLAADRIPVSVEPLAPRTIADSWVDAVDLPAHIATGASQPVTVTVGSQRDGSGEITLKATALNLTGKPAARTGAAASGAAVARRAVTFQKGLTPVVLDLTVDAPGDYVVEAQLSAPGDPLAVNNVLAREAWADPRPKVLYVEGAPSSARYLAGALEGAGFDVTIRPASAFPTTAADLAPYDVVVVSDVPRKAIPDAAMATLTDWVEKGGGGLLVAGGESVFGESGYRKTPIERLTPVTFERKDEPEVALVIVLDRSWSMAGSSMELTKTAAQAAVDVLTDEQSVGILTFNDKFDWDVTLRNVGKNRDPIRKKIAAIGPGGHTLIFPAVEQAYFALRNAKARAKHVILLSDGRSYPGEYEALVKKMTEARITLSTVAVGPSADPELLKNLATWGNGRAYAVADAAQVPEIFVKEAKNAVHARVRREGDHAGREDAGLPRLGRSRADAEIEGAHRHGAEGRRDGAGGDRRGGSAARLLADWSRTNRRLRVGREGSLGGGLGSLARLRSLLRLGGEGAAASACAAGVAGNHAWPRASRPPHHRRRDRGEGCQRSISEPAQPGGAGQDRERRRWRVGQLGQLARRHPPGRARTL